MVNGDAYSIFLEKGNLYEAVKSRLTEQLSITVKSSIPEAQTGDSIFSSFVCL